MPTNVIPGDVELRGTIRTMNEEVRSSAQRRVREIAASTSEAFGAAATVEIEDGYPVMVNSERETQHAAEAAERVTGGVNRNAPKLMGAEDFSFMLNERPGAYILSETAIRPRSTIRTTTSTTKPFLPAVRGGWRWRNQEWRPVDRPRVPADPAVHEQLDRRSLSGARERMSG